MKNIIDEVKTKFNTKKINQKRNAYDDPKNAVNLWINEIKEESNSESYNITSADDFDNELNLINLKLSKLFNVLTNFDQNKIENFISIMKKYMPLPKSEIDYSTIEWLKKGINLHENKSEGEETCLFCGNKFNIEKVIKEINVKINSEYAKVSKAMNNLIENINISKKSIDTMREIKILDDKLLTNSKKCLDFLNTSINQKLKFPNIEIFIPMNMFTLIKKLNSKINEEIKKLENKKENLKFKKHRIESVAKKRIGEEIKNNSFIRNNATIDDISELEKLLEERKIKLQE